MNYENMLWILLATSITIIIEITILLRLLYKKYQQEKELTDEEIKKLL